MAYLLLLELKYFEQLGAFVSEAGLIAMLATAACLYVAYEVFYALYLSPFRNIPGPLAARLTKVRNALVGAAGNQVHSALEESEKYGDIYVYEPDAVSISNPADIRAVFGSPAFVKSDLYKVIDLMGIENTASTRNPKFSGMRRRQIGPYLSNSYLAKMEGSILKHGILAIKEKWDGLLDRSEDGQIEINYHTMFLYTTFDVIGSLAFGKDFGALRNDDATVENWRLNTLKYYSIRTFFPILKCYPFSLLLSPFERVYRDFEDHGAKCIAERRQLLQSIEKSCEPDKKPADLLQGFLDCQDAESMAAMSPTEVHAETMIFLVAGSETTSNTLVWTTHLLMLYPECYKRAVEEVRAAFARDHVITYKEARAKLPYLEACIHEALRKIPVTGGQFPRIAPKGGLTICGHYIPGGTEVNVNVIGANHNEKYWRDPHLFDPTRFLDNDEAKRNVFTFSYGVRVCPGKQFAWYEMLTMLANILKDYDLQLPGDYTRHGPRVLDHRGYPKAMDTKHVVSNSPANPERDCRLVVSRRR